MNDTHHSRPDERQDRIRAEYYEMPGLKLTAAQASRFWHLGPAESQTLLDDLAAQGVLLRTADGHYVLLAGTSLR
jgi:hypothetical protein